MQTTISLFVALSTGVLATAIALKTGTGSAFVTHINPTMPYQVKSPQSKPIELENKISQFSDFSLLDNPAIEFDESIVAARKCAVCIGVRLEEII